MVYRSKRPRAAISIFLVLFTSAASLNINIPEEEKTQAFWLSENRKNLLKVLHTHPEESVAKNVILFLGDGMGISTITAMRILKGQTVSNKGVAENLVFDEFPYTSLARTYGVDRITSDSANSATAYFCGVKANWGTIGVDGRVQYKNCSTQHESSHVDSILKWAQDAGKWTGFVTTTRVTHATPGALYAHAADRDWEASTLDKACKDIAHQLVHEDPGKNIRVILGGGLRSFIPESKKEEESSKTIPGKNGTRKDTRNLVEEWLKSKKDEGAKAQVVYSLEEFNSTNTEKLDYLMGLFHDSHIPLVSDWPDSKESYPSLEQMTEKAIQLLSRGPKGFFLLVEGGGIDIAHHENWAQKALVEGLEFDKAIGYAVKAMKIEDTLMVVTADHSIAFTLGGDYPLRTSNILGIGGVSDIDNRTFTTLGYNNGPGYKKDARNSNLTEEEVLEKDYRYYAGIPISGDPGVHGGEDVTVYARGPEAHLFRGVHDQTYIPYVMGYASCVGPNEKQCKGCCNCCSGCQWKRRKRSSKNV